MQVKPKVTLLTGTEDINIIIAAAAKLCYSSDDVETIISKCVDGNTDKFITMLSSIGHTSVFEHASLTFSLENVSRAFTHQLVRHRIASYSQRSQRYVSESTFSYIVPKEIEDCPMASEKFLEHMECTGTTYNAIANMLSWKYISSGMNEKDSLKKAYENARSVLPNATGTSIIVTMNIRSLINFFRHRLCARSQDEMREVALMMYKLSHKLIPLCIEAGLPGCVSGRCPEGKMSCKKPYNINFFNGGDSLGN